MRVVVAMSGGVDSSLAAALVAEAGHEAIGVTLRLLPKLDTGFGCCGSPRDIDDARRVCERVGIPHYVLDLAALFEREVVSKFVREYAASRTPNPCVECNRSVKFGYLAALAEAWSADAVATGHYARVRDGRLYQALDRSKDQTYFLYSLGAQELSRALFPVGALRKSEVRRRAAALGLPTAEKPESQEICFVPGRDHRAFLASRTGETTARPGEVRDTAGRLLGRHEGLPGYTIGQRRGLPVLSRAPGQPAEPLYVVGLDAGTNTLVVGRDQEAHRPGLLAGGLSWTGTPRTGAFPASVRIRHRHGPARARVTVLDPRTARVEFEEPQRAVTPGQAAVFYDGDEVLGGGTIEAAL